MTKTDGPSVDAAGISVVPGLLIVLPFAGALAIGLGQGAIPSGLVLAAVIFFSAVAACVEAARLQMTSSKDAAGPVGWFFGTLFLYAIAVPWFLSKRRHRIQNSMSGLGVLSAMSILILLAAAGLTRIESTSAAHGTLLTAAPGRDDNSETVTFNPKVYCESVALGSASALAACLKAEQESMEEIVNATYENGAHKHCVKSALAVGGSFQVMKACLKMRRQ